MSSSTHSSESHISNATYRQTVLNDEGHALGYTLFQKLQTTLNPAQLLEYFTDILRQALVFDSISYDYEVFEITWQHGEEASQKATYQLKLKGCALGKMTFTREQAFAAQEIDMIETALSFLMYPLNNALKYQAAIQNSLLDPLTEVGNRKSLEKTLRREIEIAKRHNSPLAILMLDLDKFKVINDELGHIEGDKALKLTANILKHCARECDMPFRYGGDEFILLMSKTTQEGALLLAERLKDKIKQGLKEFQQQISDNFPLLSASIGITHLHKNDSPKRFIQRADDALREAKQSGRNYITYKNL